MTQLIPWKRGGLNARDPFQVMHQEMDRLFEDFFGVEKGHFPSGETLMVPSLDMSETKDSLLVKMDIPAMEPKDINIDVSGDVLTVSGERKQEEKKEGENYLVNERRYGSFRRSFRLPSWANTQKVDAQYRNGLLELTIGKKEESKPRSVQVKVKS